MQNEKIKLYHWLLFGICFLSTSVAGIASTLMSVYLPVAVKDLLGEKTVEDLNQISAYINAVFILGGAVGGFVSGIIGDKAGRKKAAIFAIACYGFFTLITGYMPNWRGVVLCRFFTGFGFGGVLVTTTTLMIEEWPIKSRAIFIGILSISMPIGIFSAGVIDYIVADWRKGFLVGGIPLLLALFSIWVIRESVHWKKQSGELDGLVHKKAKILLGEHRADLFSGSVIFGTMLIGLWAIFSWLPTWIQSLLPLVDAQKERGISMMMLGIGGLTGGFFSGWLANAIGLRRSMILCFAACSTFSFLLFKTNTNFSPLIYAEILPLSLFFGASQGVLSVYIPYLFPVGIRATATGFCFNIGRVFTASAVLFVGVLVSTLGGYSNALFIFSLVFVLGLTATLFSKKDAAVKIAQTGTDPENILID
jgi:MFS family permease